MLLKVGGAPMIWVAGTGLTVQIRGGKPAAKQSPGVQDAAP